SEKNVPAISGPLPTKVSSPEDNPTTAAKVELGKQLFFDPRLSLTGTVSCNSCHNVMEGGDDGRPSSMGIHGRIGPRNAPTVWNSVFQTSQFWDGRALSLEEQAKGPMVAAPEMGMPDHNKAMERIAAIPGYRTAFAKVFGKEDSVTLENAVKAIAAFERTLITPDSAYDRYVGGNHGALTESQIRGMQLFDSTGCTECHSGPAFNGWKMDATDPLFNEFPRYADSKLVTRYGLAKDLGRFEVTKQAEDKHQFKVPTLRNITITAPYFHNGAVNSLPEAVRLMAESELDVELSDKEVTDIVAFLTALEGEFPQITLPRLPSRAGESILEDQEPAKTNE
ncbi:MAG: cytochrome-c peroxidase, partial [Planctomycetaceae bacterium]|nr:cytochrome-c peroxidase [Planctomycetaceae bacterium]